MKRHILPAILIGTALLLNACSAKNTKAEFPIGDNQERLKRERGKLTGDGWNILGGGSDEEKSGGGGIGVNGFLWRATLDTLSFMPIASADPFGGVIITDWYEDPKTPGERFKVNAVILDKTLRADGVKITLFKQKLDASKTWRDETVNARLSRDLEDTILTRARELKVKQLAK